MNSIKIGLKLLFSSFLQTILVIICYDFYGIYKLSQARSATLSAIDNINPVIWYILTLEFIISLGLIVYSLIIRKKQ